MLKLISMIESIIDKAQKDHITAFSAQAAFFTILSFFPFLIVVLSLMRFFPITPEDMIELVKTYLPEQYSGAVIPIINSLNGKLTTTYMSLTILTLLWSASKGILSMMTGLNTIHEIEEKKKLFCSSFHFQHLYCLNGCCRPVRHGSASIWKFPAAAAVSIPAGSGKSASGICHDSFYCSLFSLYDRIHHHVPLPPKR